MKKILLIIQQSPFELYSGSHQRTNLILFTLLQFYEVDIICFTKEAYPANIPKNCRIQHWGQVTQINNSKLSKLREIFGYSANSYFVTNEYCKSIVSSILELNDYEFIMVRYLPTLYLCGLDINDNIIVDVDDLPEQLISSSINEDTGVLRRIYYHYMSRKISFFTKNTLSNVKHSFFSNPNQCSYKNSSYLPNIPYIQQDITDNSSFASRKNIILFVGLLAYPPNFLGLDYFITNVWRYVLEKKPDVEFRIIGRGLPEKYVNLWRNYSGISILGYVQDLVEEYEKCKVVVAPIFSGGGSNIKILEAMSLRRPCVISTFAKRGFENHLISGYNIYIAGNEKEFTDMIVNLLDSPELNKLMSENAYKIIKQYYSYKEFSSHLIQGLQS